MIKVNYFVNAIRSMGLQAIMNAKQGHPGMTISAAPINYAVYVTGINIASDNPNWINRDRFVLSGGHGSMSLYPILHFCRFISLEQIQNFRQKLSGLPGHPENISSPYIEASTGPLGQGLANGVGMAIAEAYLSNQYSQLENLINHNTFVVVGDGDLQEGISYEAMSLAGKLKLSKLIVLHDSNNWQLETSVDTVNNENIANRVKSMNWNYITCSNEPNEIIKAIKKAKKSTSGPTFIEVKTIIGEGLSFANSFNAHGGVINDNDINDFNKCFSCNFNNWNFDSNIYYHFFKNVVQKGNNAYKKWQLLLDEYSGKYPHLVKQFLQQINNEFIDINSILHPDKLPQNKATRQVAGWIMQQLGENNVKDVFVLSPDVSKSTNISISKNYFNDDKNSNMLMVGIREFSMMAIQNGIQLHGGLRTISSVFLAFSDYLKAALRLAAISEINPIIVFTHDTIAVGADGPTHQPIEQLAMLRTIPNHVVYRPCDEIETYAVFNEALSKKHNYPISIVLSRQNLISSQKTDANKAINLGGYPIINPDLIKPDLVLCAAGSEVELAIKVQELLEKEFSLTCKVFSVPNLNLFLTQSNLKQLLQAKYGVVSIEASDDPTWFKLATINSKYCNISINQFGYSLDGLDNYEYLGFNDIAITHKILHHFKNDDLISIDKINNMFNEKQIELERIK